MEISTTAIGIHDGDGVGQAVDGQLSGALNAHELGAIGAAEFAQLGGHRIERLGQLVKLIAGIHVHDLIEIPLGDFFEGACERAERAKNRAAHQQDEDDRQSDAGHRQADDQSRGAVGHVLDLALDGLHVFEVEIDYFLGAGFDQRGQTLDR